MSIKITGIFVWIALALFTFLFLKFLRWGHSQHVKERERPPLLTAEQARMRCETEKNNIKTRQLSYILSLIGDCSLNGYSNFETDSLYDENISKLIELGYKVEEIKDNTMVTIKYVISWSEDD